MPNGHTHSTDELVVPSSVSRLNYFYGQLLAQRDLVAEQAYHVVLRRLLQRELFGTGTTAGLRVDIVGPTAPRCVAVRAGLGLDADGRELLLDRDMPVEVAAPPEEASPPDPRLVDTEPDGLAGAVATLWGYAIDDEDITVLVVRLRDVGLLGDTADPIDPLAPLREFLNLISPPAGFVLPPGARLVDHLFDALVGTTYVGLRYTERGSEPSPAVLDASCCGEVSCFPARLQQGVSIVTRETPFDPPPNPAEAARLALSECFLLEQNPVSSDSDPGLDPVAVGDPHGCRRCLTDHLLSAWRPLPPSPPSCPPPSTGVVPLAAAYWSRHSRAGRSRLLSIDNHAFRPLAPGGPAIRALLEVVTQCTPPVALAPRFVAVEPGHGERLILPDGATSTRLRATANARLSAASSLGSLRWEIDFYPESGTGVSRWRSGGAAPPFDVTFEFIYDGGRTHVELVLTAPSVDPLALDPGTYLWRIAFAVDPSADPVEWEMRAETTERAVDGEPNPPQAVPSGDGGPGGSFEARFFVTAD
ncbi:MAG: hypothetical protein AAGF12_32090 [Myxococcota bacterium]